MERRAVLFSPTWILNLDGRDCTRRFVMVRQGCGGPMTVFYWSWGVADAERLCVVTRIPGRDNFRGIRKAAIFEDNSLVTFEDEEGPRRERHADLLIGFCHPQWLQLHFILTRVRT